MYVIRSLRSGKFYVGQTEDLENRLRKHNWGESRSTKAGRPWVIVHTESFETRTGAIKRERFLKSPQGWKAMVQIKSERGAAR